MHSVRRATLRAAGSSLRAAAAPRQAMAPFAMRVGSANARNMAGSLSLPRYFSQTMSVKEEDPASAISEEAKTETPAQQPILDETRIFVNNMTFDATEVHLMEAFSKFGDVTDVQLGRDGRGRSRGFAFITFKDADHAKAAVSEANKTFWHGRLINVEQAKGRGRDRAGVSATKSEPTRMLYIGNIPYETTDTDLNAMFRDLDNITAVRVAVDRNTGWPRGFAHADFTDIESATKAMEILSAKQMGGRTLRIDYAGQQKARRAGSFDKKTSEGSD